MMDYERHYERAEVVEDLPRTDCPMCDLPFGHPGQHEDIYARPDITATPEEQGLSPGGEPLLPRCPCECDCINRTASGNRCTICGPGPCRRERVG